MYILLLSFVWCRVSARHALRPSTKDLSIPDDPDGQQVEYQSFESEIEDSLADPSSCTELSLTSESLCNSTALACAGSMALQLEKLGEAHAQIKVERDQLRAEVCNLCEIVAAADCMHCRLFLLVSFWWRAKRQRFVPLRAVKCC